MAENLTQLIEAMDFAASKVDRENCRIHRVKICGKVSKNGREYSDRSLRESAKCSEGKGTNIDHDRTGKERSIRDCNGWLSECQAEINGDPKTDGVFATVNLLKSHPLTETVLEIAERNPGRIGMSHVAQGVTKTIGGKTIVESIESVQSVDFVQNPATTSGLHESEEPVSKTKTLREFVDGIADHPDKNKLLKLMESDPALGAAMMTGEPDGDEGGTDGAVKAAFEAAIVAAFRDDSLDMKATLAKIKAVLKAYDGLSGATEAPTEDKGTEKTMESVEEENRQLKAREGARVLLESAGVTVNTNRIGLLAGLNDEAGRKSLVEDWKKLDAGAVQKPRPRSGSILHESQGTGKSYDELTAGGFAKAVR